MRALSGITRGVLPEEGAGYCCVVCAHHWSGGGKSAVTSRSIVPAMLPRGGVTCSAHKTRDLDRLVFVSLEAAVPHHHFLLLTRFRGSSVALVNGRNAAHNRGIASVHRVQDALVCENGPPKRAVSITRCCRSEMRCCIRDSQNPNRLALVVVCLSMERRPRCIVRFNVRQIGDPSRAPLRISR